MPTSCPKIFVIPTVGIVLALATFVGGAESAVAGNVPAVSKVVESSVSEKLLLAQVVHSSPCPTCLDQNAPTASPVAVTVKISDQNAPTASPVAVPVKIPEPSMLVGLGLVACSLVVTRRRVKD